MAFTDDERATLRFVNNRFYLHKVLRINYTSYDMRREQDSLNPRTHANVMMLSLHCPRVGLGQAKAIFAGPDPGPQGWATLSLALARGQADPGPIGSGQGRPWPDDKRKEKYIYIVNNLLYILKYKKKTYLGPKRHAWRRLDPFSLSRAYMACF